MSRYIGRSIYMGSGHTYTAEVLQECQDCGALVKVSYTEKHSEFHDNIAEIIEVLRSVTNARP